MGYTLKALRANKDWTKKEAANAVGVSVETWANWEKKKTFPDVRHLQKIENVFSVTYNDIIFL